MLKIGDFSKLSRISVRMLRHYDEIGLLTPEVTDEWTGYRYYSEYQLPAAGRIQALKGLGFSLANIRDIMKQYEDPEIMEQFLLIKQRELEEQHRELDQRLRMLNNMLSWLRKDGSTMNYNVTVKTLPERYVASVCDVIPSYDQEGILWHTLVKETEHLNLQAANPCYTLAIFHDGEFKEKDVLVEVQKDVTGRYEDTEHVKFKTVPPVQFASVTYKGGYDQISQANQAVFRWISENGYEIAGISFNIYHVSPHETNNPDEFVTEVCFPVKKPEK